MASAISSRLAPTTRGTWLCSPLSAVAGCSGSTSPSITGARVVWGRDTISSCSTGGRLSTSQFIAVMMVVATALVLPYLWRKKRIP